MSVALSVLTLAAGLAVPVRADVSSIDRLQSPIVRVNVQRGDVTIQTWNRESVQVDGDPTVVMTRRIVEPRAGDRSILIPQASAQTREGALQLAPEGFVVPPIPPGPRDMVIVRSKSPADVGAVTVRVPPDSIFVFAHAAHGALDIHDYKGGTLVAFAGRGRLALDNVGGTVFAQANRGPLIARNSNFDRIRARSLTGNMAFERCNVRQIEATSVAGSIVYDGGSFQPGLARFESTTGNVAIGTSGGAALGARTTGGGHVFTNFPAGTRVSAHADAATANVGGGGPVVTATSGSGNVYLYGGSLRTRTALPPTWQAVTQALDRPSQRVAPDVSDVQREQRNLAFPARLQIAPPASLTPRVSPAQPRYRQASARSRLTNRPSTARPAQGAPRDLAVPHARMRRFRG